MRSFIQHAHRVVKFHAHRNGRSAPPLHSVQFVRLLRPNVVFQTVDRVGSAPGIVAHGTASSATVPSVFQDSFSTSHRPEIVFQWVQNEIVDNVKTGVLSIPPPLLTRAFQELANGMMKYHDAAKFARVPFPLPYTIVVELLLAIYAVVTPIVVSSWAEQVGWGTLFSFVLVFVVWSMHVLALELENPYGADANDLDMGEIQCDLNRHLVAALAHGHEKAELVVGADEAFHRVKAQYRRRVSASVISPTLLSSFSSIGLHLRSHSASTLPDCSDAGIGGERASRISISDAGIGGERASRISMDLSDLGLSEGARCESGGHDGLATCESPESSRKSVDLAEGVILAAPSRSQPRPFHMHPQSSSSPSEKAAAQTEEHGEPAACPRTTSRDEAGLDSLSSLDPLDMLSCGCPPTVAIMYTNTCYSSETPSVCNEVSHER